MIPLIGLCGVAGAGKDTVGNYLSAALQGTVLGLADPLKRGVADLFDFTPEQLWGPSDLRNEVDPRYLTSEEVVDRLTKRLASEAPLKLLELAEWRGRASLSNHLEKLAAGAPLTPRVVLQVLGTDWGRALEKNIWVDHLLNNTETLLQGGCSYSRSEGVVPAPNYPGYGAVVVTDVRFRNEILAIKSAGGVVIKVHRDRGSLDSDTHVSETEQHGVPANFFDAVFHNTGTLDCLPTLNMLLSSLFPQVTL